MSKLIICSVCGGMNIQTERRPDGDRHCLDCGSRWKIGSEQESKKQTLFDRITQSPEVLAPHFVFLKAVFATNSTMQQQWVSTLTGEVYPTKEEAIAATVARFKEVCDV